MSYYDSFYSQKKPRTNIAYRIRIAVIASLIGQYISDIIFDLVLDDDELIANFVGIRDLSSYYAAAFAGIITGALITHMDLFALNAIVNASYVYSINFFGNLIYDREGIINQVFLVEDIIATTIIIYFIDDKAINSYINEYREKHCLPDFNLDEARDIKEIAIVIVVINLYALYRYQERQINIVDVTF